MTPAAAATVLEPLAARYAWWLGLPVAAVRDGPEAAVGAGGVLAMQLVLRLERAAPPPRTALLEAAAAAAVAVCLDPRSAPGGEWHPAVATWVAGRIRKVSRRARGTHWRAVQPLPGHTVLHRGAEVRALVPGLVAALPREVSRLQVTGTDLPPDEPGPPPPGEPVLWFNPSVPLTAGKAAAQAGHATMLAAALLHATGDGATLAAWAARGYRVAARTAPREVWHELHPGDEPLTAWRQRRTLAVRDAGYTEIPPGTVTVLAQFPPCHPQPPPARPLPPAAAPPPADLGADGPFAP